MCTKGYKLNKVQRIFYPFLNVALCYTCTSQQEVKRTNNLHKNHVNIRQ